MSIRWFGPFGTLGCFGNVIGPVNIWVRDGTKQDNQRLGLCRISKETDQLSFVLHPVKQTKQLSFITEWWAEVPLVDFFSNKDWLLSLTCPVQRTSNLNYSLSPWDNWWVRITVVEWNEQQHKTIAKIWRSYCDTSLMDGEGHCTFGLVKICLFEWCFLIDHMLS